jgi:hypothetical protein
MSETISPTAITSASSTAATGGVVSIPSAPGSPRRQRSPIVKALSVIASLRLTVVLFALALMVIFCGTLAMREMGLWTAVSTYFRSFYVWVPFSIFFPSDVKVSGGFPFVGGWTVGTVLCVNLVAAHIARFRYTWKRAGIVIIHTGIFLLMAGELVTGLYATESFLTALEGQSVNYAELHDTYEIAFVSPNDAKTDHHIAVPVSLLKNGGRYRNPQVPFDLEMTQFMVNSTTEVTYPRDPENPATAGIGRDVKVLEKPESGGASSKQRANLASAYLRLYKKGTDEVVGTYLVTMWTRYDRLAAKKQTVSVDGTTYDLSMRYRRSYKPYTIHLVEFTHGRYEGTNIPKDFRSRVEVLDPEHGVERTVDIFMNNPLRYRGETFYQSSVEGMDEGTVLQVVRNPGWLLPYASCILVAVGMVVHFGAHLRTFLRRRATT